MEEEVVRRWEEGRGRMEVRPEGPERLDRGKGGDLFDALFVVRDLISRRALLAEPEDPSVGTGTVVITRTVVTRWILDRAFKEGGTYVRATEGVDRQCGGEPCRGRRGAFFSHGCALLLVREGRREVFGWYARGWWCCAGEQGRGSGGGGGYYCRGR